MLFCTRLYNPKPLAVHSKRKENGLLCAHSRFLLQKFSLCPVQTESWNRCRPSRSQVVGGFHLDAWVFEKSCEQNISINRHMVQAELCDLRGWGGVCVCGRLAVTVQSDRHCCWPCDGLQPKDGEFVLFVLGIFFFLKIGPYYLAATGLQLTA